MSEVELKLENKPTYTIVRCNGELTGNGAEDLRKLITASMGTLATAVILDLKQCTKVDSQFGSTLQALSKSLKDNRKELFVINCAAEVADFIKTSGLATTIRVMGNLQDVLGAFRAAPRIDLNFIKPFIQGAVDVLRIQCSFSAHAGKPFLKGQGPDISPDIAAVIGLTSKAFNGSVAICFPQNIFLTLMGNMLGEKYQTITRDLEDGAAELLNIIFSQAKTVLNEKGYAIEKAIPTIVRGTGISVRHLTPEVTIVLPFESPLGIFHVEVAIETSGG